MASGVEIRAEGELLRKIVDHLPAMIAYWDSEQRCRFANRAYVRWFGVTPEWLFGRHISELLGALYRLNLPYIERVLGGEPQQFEREIPDPTGGPPRQSLASYIPDLVGDTVRGFFVLVTDISEIKRAHRALEESEARFSRTIDEAPIGMALVALDGRFLRVNRTLCEIVGYAPEELTGLTFQSITHPADLDTDLALAAKLARGEIPRYQLEKRYIRKDKSTVDVMLSGSVVRSADGTPIHYVAQVEDITERKRLARHQSFLAEIGEVLASSLDYDETLTKIAQLAARELADVCIVDIIEDDASVRRLNVASRDPRKANVCDVLKRRPIDRNRPYLLREVLAHGQSVLMERPSPETIAAFSQNEEHLQALKALDIRSLIGVPLIARGRLLGAIALVSSAPDRTFGPADVRLAEELARRAALSIDNARLYREARMAARARDEVLGIVAHDLRNPLNAILLQTQLMRRLRGSHGTRDPSGAIERAALRMNRLIQDLLDVTRMEAGRLSLSRDRVDAGQVIQESAEMHQPLAASALLKLEVESSGPLPAVWGDRDRLLQAFENLIGNAIKFTARGGRVVIGASSNDGEVVFFVRNSGAGIPPESVPKLFDRFWQGHGGERMGAGLGLAITKAIVEGHGGRIWVESAPGKDTTFLFTIPTFRDERVGDGGAGRSARPHAGY